MRRLLVARKGGPVLEAQPAERDPFERLRARWLILLAVGSAALVYTALSGSGRLSYAQSPLEEWIRLLMATLAATGVLLGVATRAGVDVLRLFGDAPTRKEVLLALSCATPMVMLGLGGVALIAGISPQAYSEAPRLFPPSKYWASPVGVASILSIVAVTPLCEEFAFRGLLLHRWAIKWNVRTSIVAQTVLFATLHLNPIAVAVYGYVMAVLYLRTQKLWVPIISHAATNAALLVVPELVGASGLLETPEGLRVLRILGASFLAVSAAWVFTFVSNTWSESSWSLPHGQVTSTARVGEKDRMDLHETGAGS